MSLYQFQKLAQVPSLKTSYMKADFDIAFKNAIRKNDATQMDLTTFFDAVEVLAGKLKSVKGNTAEQLETFISSALDYFQE